MSGASIVIWRLQCILVTQKKHLDIEESDIPETKCSDSPPLHNNLQFHDANQLTGEIKRILGDRSLGFKVMLPVDNHMLARRTHCDRDELRDKIIFTPIQLPTDGELLSSDTLWTMVTLADDGIGDDD